VRDAAELPIAGQSPEFAPAQTCGGQGRCEGDSRDHEQVERDVVDGHVE
jgi:hypothetical protein